MSAKKKLTTSEQLEIDRLMPGNQNALLGQRLGDCESGGVVYVDCIGTGPWYFTMPFDGYVTDVSVQCYAAHTSGTLQLRNGSSVISDAIIAAVAKAITRSASLDPAYGGDPNTPLAQGTQLNVNAANAAEGRVTVYVRRA